MITDQMKALRPIEKRILAYLDQRGPADRTDIVCDLANPESKIGRGFVNGTNAGIPRLMGAWSKRLVAAGYVSEKRDREGYYIHHNITSAGRNALRSDCVQGTTHD